MADIFYSKEILKNVNRNGYHVQTGKNMQRIRGLYVTGVWRPPHCIDRHLFITNIGLKNIPAKVEEFTTVTKYERPGDYLTGINQFSSTKPDIKRFTTVTKYERPGDYLTGIIAFESLGPPTYRKFDTVTKYERPGDYLTGINEFETTPLTLVSFYKADLIEEAPGKPSLQITNISGTEATVENA